MKYVFTQSPRSQSSWPMAWSPEPQVHSPVKANPDRNKTGHSAKLFPPEPRAPPRTLTVSSCLKKELGKNLARAPAFGSFLMKNKHISRTQNEKARLPCHKSQLWVWSVSVVRSPQSVVLSPSSSVRCPLSVVPCPCLFAKTHCRLLQLWSSFLAAETIKLCELAVEKAVRGRWHGFSRGSRASKINKSI